MSGHLSRLINWSFEEKEPEKEISTFFVPDILCENEEKNEEKIYLSDMSCCVDILKRDIPMECSISQQERHYGNLYNIRVHSFENPYTKLKFKKLLFFK